VKREIGWPCHKRVRLALCATACLSSATCLPQNSLDQTLRTLEEQRRQIEAESDRARIRSLEFEADIARMRADTERMRLENERMAAERELQAAGERARRETARQEATIKAAADKAEQAADEMRAELNRAAVRNRNNLYSLGLTAALVGFGAFVFKLKRRRKPMTKNEKFGLITIIVSFLSSLFFLMISTNWIVALDFLTNVMLTLKIQFLKDDDNYGQFIIDFPTKYLILLCLSAAAYGVTTYLGITPVPWKATTARQPVSSEPPEF
jgi:hypothetical protein